MITCGNYNTLRESQFLPQDKVSAFAQLNPSELLRETERAAGGDKLLKVHDDLIAFRRQERKFINEADQWNSKLQNLEARNQAVEREVTRYLERDAIMKKISILKLTIPWIRYDEAISTYQEAKEVKNDAKREYEEIQARGAPLEDEIKQAKVNYQKHEQSAKTSHKEVRELGAVSLFSMIE